MLINTLYSLFSILFAYLAYRKPYLGVTIICLIISIGPLLKLIVDIDNMNVIYATCILIYFTMTFIRLFSSKSIVILFFVIVLIICLLQFFLIDLFFWQKGALLLKYIAFPYVAYFSARSIVKNNINISYLLTIYIVPGLLILFYRFFIDYSFLGIFPMIANYSAQYRPSSLNSSITFSIELAIYLCLLSMTSTKIKYFIIMISLSALPLILMHSRSSYIILIVFFLYYFIANKLYKQMLVVIGTCSLFFVTYILVKNELPYIFTIFNYTEGDYGARFGSIFNATNIFSNQGFSELLFGKGLGTASTFGRRMGLEVIYVENAFVTILLENGIVFFFIFLMFHLYVFVKFRKTYETRLLSILIIAVFLTNLFSASLLINTIQMIYWLIIFYGIERLNLVKHASVENRKLCDLSMNAKGKSPGMYDNVCKHSLPCIEHSWIRGT